jgi:hypothetical protein
MAKKGIGRPPEYNEVICAQICQLIGEGFSLRKVCAMPEMPSKTTVLNWLLSPAFDDSPVIQAFRVQYDQARARLLEHWADELLDIADNGTNDWQHKENSKTGEVFECVDTDHISRSRLRVDTRKWLLSKLRPERYGDTVTQKIEGGQNPLSIKTIDAPPEESYEQWLARRIKELEDLNLKKD